MKGLIINSNKEYYTLLKQLFDDWDGVEQNYNWLITSYECYPVNKSYADLFSGDYCWLDGGNFSEMINDEDFQWIWGAFSAFPKNISKEEALKYSLPIADGNSRIWETPVSMQHPLAEIEILAWDSSCTIVICKDERIIEKLLLSEPDAEDLEEFLLSDGM